MPSLRSINKEIGTNFKRWKEVTKALTPIEEVKPTPIPEVDMGIPISTDAKPTPEVKRYEIREDIAFKYETNADIAKALAEGYTLKDVANGRNVARRMHGKIAAAQHRHGKDSPEVLEAINEANRVSVMLTTARAAYNRIRYPERYA